MALCEPPELFLRRSGIAPITTGARLDVIIDAARTQYALGWDIVVPVRASRNYAASLQWSA